MEEVKPAREAWLITGIPGAGKSTIARLLTSRLPRAAHIEGDRLQEWIVSGAVYPGQKPAAEAERQIQLCIHHQCLPAQSFAQAGFVPVLDYVIVSRTRLDAYRNALAELDQYLVVVNPGREVALHRDSERPEKTVAHFWVHLQDELVRELSGTGLWAENGGSTAQQTVELILRERARARLEKPE